MENDFKFDEQTKKKTGKNATRFVRKQHSFTATITSSN